MAQYERVAIGKVKRPLPEMPGLFGITKAESNDDLALIKASHEELLAGNNVASRSGAMKRRKKSAGAASEAEPIDEDEKTSKRLRLASKVGRERKNLATQKTSHQNMRRHLEAVRLEINHYRDAIAQARREIQSATADRDILEDDYNSLRAQLQRDVNIARQNQQDYKNSILEFHERYNHEFSQEKDFGKLLEDLRRLESDIRNRDQRLHELTQELRKAHMERELITDALRRHTGYTGAAASSSASAAAASSATTSPTITAMAPAKPASSPGPASSSAASSSSSPASSAAPGGTVLSAMKAHNASITSPTSGASSPPPSGLITSPLSAPATGPSEASASAPSSSSQDVAMEPVKTEGDTAPVTASVVTAQSAGVSSSSAIDLPSELVLIRQYATLVEQTEHQIFELKEKNADLESQVHSRNRTIEDLRKQLDEASKGSTEAASTTKSAETRLKELSEQQDLLRKENETLKKELDTYKADVQQYEEKARMHQEIVDAADQRASEAASGVVELITQLKVLKSGADTLQSYNLRMRTELQSSEEQLTAARNELKEHKNATRKLTKEVSRLRGEADHARLRVASLYQQNKELQDRLIHPHSRVQEMLSTLEKQVHQQQIAAATQMLKQLTSLPASAFDEHDLAALQSDPSLLSPSSASGALGAAAQ